MDTISSISELLSLSKSQYRIYDLSRTVTKLSKESFEKIENNQLPYPTPNQGHAHIAIAFWQENKAAPYLWFVKLPLDERGLLNQGARNHFIAIIMEALGNDLSQDPTEKQEELLKSNPYHFTPSQYKLAYLNSELNYSLTKSSSQFLADCEKYFSGELGWDNWHNIGVQGITDYVVRLNDEKAKLQALCAAIPHLDKHVLSPLCSALENSSLSVELIEHLTNRFNAEEDSAIKLDLLRALATSSAHPFVISLIENELDDTISEEMLIVIAGRNWQALAEQSRMKKFLETLASKGNMQLFAAIFKDLVSVPLLRPIVFACMRDNERSDDLGKAIGQLFN